MPVTFVSAKKWLQAAIFNLRGLQHAYFKAIFTLTAFEAFLFFHALSVVTIESRSKTVHVKMSYMKGTKYWAVYLADNESMGNGFRACERSSDSTVIAPYRRYDKDQITFLELSKFSPGFDLDKQKQYLRLVNNLLQGSGASIRKCVSDGPR